MKTNHTPGPWHVNTLEVVPYSIHAHRGVVAEVSRGTMNEVRADEIEANVRLIAAAPELLAALEWLLKSPDLNLDELDRQTIGAIETANHALAKARGGKPH